MKNHKKSQIVGIKFFLLFLLDDRWEGSGSVPLTNGSGSRRPEYIRIPDPDHCFEVSCYVYLLISLLLDLEPWECGSASD
jgi:hypothetical protein